MKSILDDRKMFDKKEFKEQLHLKDVLPVLIASSQLFLRRDCKGHLLPEWSDLVINEVKNKFDSCIIISVSTTIEIEYDFKKFGDKFLFIEVNKDSVTQWLDHVLNVLHTKKIVPTLSGYAMKTKRLVTPLNLKDHLSHQRLQIAYKDDHEKLGITLDKDKTLNDLAKIRSRSSW